MYRSMDSRKIERLRAGTKEVDFLIKVGAMRNGTHTATLVPYEKSISFVNGESPVRNEKKKD